MKLDTEENIAELGDPEAGPQQKRKYRKSQRAQAEEATGEAILDTALVAFSHEPFDRVTLQSIADTSGVTVQTVIRRFGSKESLFQILVERERPRILASRIAAETAGLSAALEVLLNHYEQDGDMVLNFIAQEHLFENVGSVVEEGRRVHREWVERYCHDLLVDTAGVERERLLHAAIVATDLSTWKLLRRDLGLQQVEVMAVMSQILNALKGDK
ncbi:MAG: TetR/AcrR family transcriptional regulator [Chloroflexota bacterium]